MLLQHEITTIILQDFVLLYKAIFNILSERNIEQYTRALNKITKIRFIDNDLFEKETIDKLISFIALFKNISEVEIVDKTTVLELQNRGLKNVSLV